VLVAGAAVQWLRDGLGIIGRSREVEALARSVPDSGGVVFVPAFAGLGTPEWDPHARGLLIGITRGTTRAHVARATLEAIAAQVREVQLALEDVRGAPLGRLRVDGGAAADDLLLEIQARLSKLVVERSDDLETTARGALRIAMLGVRGGDPATLPAAAQPARTFEPHGDAAADAAWWRRWRAAVARARGFAREG
jgi:glycerol kinase